MRPAFASAKQAAAFALLLLILVLLPLLLPRSFLSSRDQVYSNMWWGSGDFPYIDQQIYHEKGDIDIAFIGSSRIWHAINTPYVQEQLSEHLGRPAVVRSFAWNGGGFDGLYFVARDLLQHRKIRMLVFYDDDWTQHNVSPLTPQWFRFADNAEVLPGLPVHFQLLYYFASIIGTPRTLLSMVRTSLPMDLNAVWDRKFADYYQSSNPALALGSMPTRKGFGPLVGHDENAAPFVDFHPSTNPLPTDACIYSPTTRDRFLFSGPSLSPASLHFARKFAAMASEAGSTEVILSIPEIPRAKEKTISEREFWPDSLQADVTMVGIPPALLFAGISDRDLPLLFQDSFHLNKNGEEYFTRAITPALLQIYSSHFNH